MKWQIGFEESVNCESLVMWGREEEGEGKEV